ncbi:MAG: C4-type zinc ribbon domain-containing protein, partial [Deltaproteobacteria bacterium]|nr:C4-type zinc ribbon domain-containing protein [Deltaproteobacteria bacterium]
AQETIEKFEEHMKNVTNQKEYIAARKQVDEARRLNTRLQDEILERRVSQEELTPSLEERTQRHNKVSEGFEEERKVIDQERSELEKEFAGLEKEIGEILSDLGGDFLARYQRLIKGGRAPAVVPVVSGSCKGCRMSLPPQAYNLMLARVDDLHTCPTCTRFIYIKPEQEQEGEEQASGVAAG